jgi:hypothetical protein
LSRIPYESLSCIKPSLFHLHTFENSAHIYSEKYTQTKLEPKSKLNLFMGYFNTNKAYCIWNLTKNKIAIKHDAIFHETSPFHMPAPDPL